MPNIRILAQVVLQILQSQGCDCVRKMGVTQPNIYGIGWFKHIYFKSNIHGNYNIVTYINIIGSERRHYSLFGSSPKGIGSKVNQFIYTLVCNYMPNIRILAKAVLQIFCSKGCSYTKCLCLKKGNKPTENFWNRRKS